MKRKKGLEKENVRNLLISNRSGNLFQIVLVLMHLGVKPGQVGHELGNIVTTSSRSCSQGAWRTYSSSHLKTSSRSVLSSELGCSTGTGSVSSNLFTSSSSTLRFELKLKMSTLRVELKMATIKLCILSPQSSNHPCWLPDWWSNPPENSTLTIVS